MDYDDGVTVSGRYTRSARSTGNGRTLNADGRMPGTMYGRPQGQSLSQQIQALETDAYFAVLRAFVAQSDAISWDKERLMSQLRRELNVDDSLHSDMLERVHADAKIQQIRSLKSQGITDYVEPSLPLDQHTYANPSRKKQKMSSQPSVPISTAPTPLKAEPVARRGVPKGRVKKGKLDVEIDPWIGKRVKTRWTEDDGRSAFYEAVITDYVPEKLPKQDLIWVDSPTAIPGNRVVPGVTPAKPGTRSGKKAAPRSAQVASGYSRGVTKSAPPLKSQYTRSDSISDRNSHDIGNGRHDPSMHAAAYAIPVLDFPSIEKMFAIDRIEQEEDLLKLQNAHQFALDKTKEIQKSLTEIGETSDEEDVGEDNEDNYGDAGALLQRGQPFSKLSGRGREEDEEQAIHGSPVRSSNYGEGDNSPRNEGENYSNNSRESNGREEENDNDGEG